MPLASNVAMWTPKLFPLSTALQVILLETVRRCCWDLSNRIITCVWLRFKGTPNVAETYLHKRHLGNYSLLFRFPFIVYCQDPFLVSIYCTWFLLHLWRVLLRPPCPLRPHETQSLLPRIPVKVHGVKDIVQVFPPPRVVGYIQMACWSCQQRQRQRNPHPVSKSRPKSMMIISWGQNHSLQVQKRSRSYSQLRCAHNQRLLCIIMNDHEWFQTARNQRHRVRRW